MKSMNKQNNFLMQNVFQFHNFAPKIFKEGTYKYRIHKLFTSLRSNYDREEDHNLRSLTLHKKDIIIQ